ncbi:MAG: AmmeMemoRadiSam system protein B [Nitrospiraceae bacterium]|nr:AmmeMemoRadiSam system protein B [Nitrospiraceae bacterium]
MRKTPSRRLPAVAGQFYPGSREALAYELKEYTERGLRKQKAIAAVCPHAGYMYSGAVAGAVYSAIEVPQTVVLLGPNHSGFGPQFSIMSEGEWELPNGLVPINSALAELIIKEAPGFIRNSTAQVLEHSLEVQVPFITYFRPDADIVPIVMLQAGLDELKEAGLGLARAIRAYGKDVLIVASSDMSHYVPDEEARRKDRMAIEKILALDAGGLFSTVIRERITMCGYIPATVMLFAAKALGAKEAALVKYATSGEVSGDFSQVVGYAGIAVR